MRSVHLGAIHPSAWNRNSRKSVCTILYNSSLSGRDKGEHPGPTHSSQHHMLWTCIKVYIPELQELHNQPTYKGVVLGKLPPATRRFPT
jgi:hypothetical protein